jgi:hypothetical protein
LEGVESLEGDTNKEKVQEENENENENAEKKVGEDSIERAQ